MVAVTRASPIREDGLIYDALNFETTALINWRLAVAKVRRGTANAKLALIGDSTTRGLGGNGGNNGDVLNSYPTQLATILNKKIGLTTGVGNLIGGSAGGATPITGLDSRVTFGGGWTSSAGTTAGGTLLTSTASGTLAFTPVAAFDTADIYYPRNSGWGTWNANIGGGSSTLITNSNANAFLKATLTGSLAVQAVNCVWASGSAFLAGIDTYDSATKQISVWNMGWSGATAGNWNNSTWLYGPLSSIATYDPDLSIINLGINDWTAGTSLATFAANLQALITACKAVGDAIIVTPTPTQVSGGVTLAVQGTYVEVIKGLARTNNVPVVDLWTRFGSWEAMDALGAEFGANHPNGLGYADMAQAIANVLVAAV